MLFHHFHYFPTPLVLTLEKMSKVNPLLDGLIQSHIKEHFLEHLETIYDQWAGLIVRGTIPPGMASADPRVEEALEKLYQSINNDNTTMSRYASVQLTRLMAALRENITADRSRGKFVNAKARRSDAISLDTYIRALGGSPNDPVNRIQAQKHLRLSKRWADLASGAPLLVITLSKKADEIVCVKKFVNETHQYC